MQQVTEKNYFYSLGALPPLKQGRDFFILGEVLRHEQGLNGEEIPVYLVYFEKDGLYYKRETICTTYNTVQEIIDDIEEIENLLGGM